MAVLQILLLLASLCAAQDFSGGQAIWVPAHNEVRCGWGVAPLVWSATLESDARTWASSCPTPAAPHDPTSQDGENVFFLSTGAAPFSGAIVSQVWASEASSWTCQTNSCNDTSRCLHFTQMVWFDTTLLGCAAVTNCPGAYATVYVCRYRVAGNRNGLHPLGSSPQCSLNGGGSCSGTTPTTSTTTSTTSSGTSTPTTSTSTTAQPTTTPAPTPQPPYPSTCPAEQTIVKKIRPPSSRVKFEFGGMFDGLCKDDSNVVTPTPCPSPCTGVNPQPQQPRGLGHLVL